ncbi:MAG: TetR/AcrR family transcriptional regulator C-terminal domain-containing protein [Treponema sp.]|nr:TetR/AcrR family transcriptional regulator C-terminal domain-containing protein [Treponema sp.]
MKNTETKLKGNPENNRNVRRTKLALRNSLIELMKNKSILRISVKEICDTADVGRSTFYAHYESHYNLLEDIENESLSIFEEKLSMDQPLRKYNNQEISLKFEKTLQFIADNTSSIQILLSENGDLSFQRKFIRRLVNYFKNAKKHYTDNLIDEKTSECYTVFVIHGAIALIQHWLTNGMHISISDLAKMITSLTREMRQ